MEIRNSAGHGLELKILRYEFPRNLSNRYDANWLIVEVNISHPKGNWIANAPCMLTWDVERLAKWFEDITNNLKLRYKLFMFYEPELKLELKRKLNKKFIRVYLDYEFKPDWFEKKFIKDAYLDFPLSEIDLNRMAHQLRKQLEKFPERVVDEG